jgi:positive regulator of sigma E activity
MNNFGTKELIVAILLGSIIGFLLGFLYGRDFEKNQNKNAIDIRVPGVQFQYK